jgi:hypothetical protein
MYTLTKEDRNTLIVLVQHLAYGRIKSNMLKVQKIEMGLAVMVSNYDF